MSDLFTTWVDDYQANDEDVNSPNVYIYIYINISFWKFYSNKSNNYDNEEENSIETPMGQLWSILLSFGVHVTIFISIILPAAKVPSTLPLFFLI